MRGRIRREFMKCDDGNGGLRWLRGGIGRDDGRRDSDRARLQLTPRHGVAMFPRAPDGRQIVIGCGPGRQDSVPGGAANERMFETQPIRNPQEPVAALLHQSDDSIRAIGKHETGGCPRRL